MASSIRDFKDLEVWQESMRLCKIVYEATARFPAREQFGLTAQIRRAAVSIPSNLAEGHARAARQDYIRFVRMARGSAAEVETQAILAQQLAYVSEETFETLNGQLQCVKRLSNGLLRGLSPRSAAPNPQPPIPNPRGSRGE